MLLFSLMATLLVHTNGVRVLTSKVKMSEYENANGGPYSGAHLEDTSLVKLTDLSLCMRFNYKILGSTVVDGKEGRNRLFTIADFRTDGFVSRKNYYQLISFP